MKDLVIKVEIGDRAEAEAAGYEQAIERRLAELVTEGLKGFLIELAGPVEFHSGSTATHMTLRTK